MMEPDIEIDDSLYSRQRYVLGDSAMKRMAKSNVFLYGLGGLGVEIAKNIILAGVKSITIYDEKTSSFYDLGQQFFLTEEDVKEKRNRCEASLSKLAELNPYVKVSCVNQVLDRDTDLEFLSNYQCVILNEVSLAVQLKVNEYCRTHNIQFISGDVRGVTGWIFCDFGDEFEVVDANGEEPKESFISSISKNNPGIVTTLENQMHGFEDGDTVEFKEIGGMTQLNGMSCKIKVQSPYAFSICDTSSFSNFDNGGIACQVKVASKINHESLRSQLVKPSLVVADLSKFDAPNQIHLGIQALDSFSEKNNRLPKPKCDEDSAELIAIAKELNTKHLKLESIDEVYFTQLSHTSQGCFAPLCAALGGIMAQEALKALTGKFTPLTQWICLDACEVLSGLENQSSESFLPRDNRYDSLRVCVGEELCSKLAHLKLFMVGCGAIGCEMLKNYAVLGVASSENGLITITDNDLIEKSNLNRQFLFRPRHIRQAKSTTAAGSAREINPSLNIEAHQHRVCPKTEANVYNDAFFSRQDIIVNALDNVEARRYVDSRCVTNCRPLMETGTMGAKGHVQVIIPHLTESYASQQDPVDHGVPYCTLKSFPATIEHCIQWARDKFESSFAMKPSLYNKFWELNNYHEVIEKLKKNVSVDNVFQVSKVAANRPTNWHRCVETARLKFEKYFNHRAKHLLHAFPLDTKLQDGTLFWQSPKRPPTPVEFDINNKIHFSFIVATARLYAAIAKVPTSDVLTDYENIKSILKDMKIPQFVSVKKSIVTDESVKKPDEQEFADDDLVEAANRLSMISGTGQGDTVMHPMDSLEFEKDDDTNGHIDFITAASNLRAMMYQIEVTDRLKTKRIAGRIVPAIATTTAAVAGLVTVELIKTVMKKELPLEAYKNCFLNLALPVVVCSEPGPVQVNTLSNGLKFTMWDNWVIRGNKDWTLQQFLDSIKTEHGVSANMVVYGVKMIYVPMMPMHKKRLPQTMLKLLKPATGKEYVDLVVSFESAEEEDEMGPPVRYYLY